MSRLFKFTRTSLFILFLFQAIQARATDSICDSGTISPPGYNTVYHQASWDIYDIYTAYDNAYVYTGVSGPVYDTLTTSMTTGTGATVTHYLQNPPNGFIQIDGYLALSTYTYDINYGGFWTEYAWDGCPGYKYVYNV